MTYGIIPINYLAVLVGALASMVLGFVWYSPQVFGKRWMKLTGLSQEELRKESMMRIYIFSFVAALVMAWMLARFIHYAAAFSLISGIKTGVWAWLGFVAPTSLVNYMFQKKPLELYLVDVGYHLVALMAMGAIIAAWR